MKLIFLIISLLLVVSYYTFTNLSLAATPSPTPSPDSIREKVEQKVQQALNQPKAYLGTVTNDTEGTLQIRAQNGEIKQISTKSVTSVIRVGKPDKEVKLTDLAIGDFIAALGYKNSNGVLDAKRILIVLVPTPSSIKHNFGKVSNVSKKNLTIKSSNQEITINLTTNTDYLVNKEGVQSSGKLSDILPNDSVVVVGTINGSAIDARSIIKTLESQPTPSPSASASPKSTPTTKP